MSAVLYEIDFFVVVVVNAAICLEAQSVKRIEKIMKIVAYVSPT